MFKHFRKGNIIKYNTLILSGKYRETEAIKNPKTLINNVLGFTSEVPSGFEPL